jgi:ketosteroid isomerase-like protein
MPRTIVAVLASYIAIVACQPSPTELTDEQRAAIRDTVDALMVDFWDAVRHADFDRGLTFFHDAPETALAYEGRTDYTLATLDSVYRPGYAATRSQERTIADSRTTVLAPDVVYVMQRGILSATDTAGTTYPATPFAFTVVWVRRNGEWKVLLGHQSDGLPESL